MALSFAVWAATNHTIITRHQIPLDYTSCLFHSARFDASLVDRHGRLPHEVSERLVFLLLWPSAALPSISQVLTVVADEERLWNLRRDDLKFLLLFTALTRCWLTLYHLALLVSLAAHFDCFESDLAAKILRFTADASRVSLCRSAFNQDQLVLLAFYWQL